MEELIKLMNAIKADLDGFNVKLPEIVLASEFDLSRFEDQSCDIDGIDIEYVDQHGDGDNGYYGTIAYPFNEYVILVEYFE